MDSAKDSEFAQAVWQYYRQHGRHDLPWRKTSANGSIDPYRVFVSELMLQQTQVSRVIPKFEEFITRFPSFAALAAASLGEVLQAWSGLGYNRRAKFLWQSAQVVHQTCGDHLPDALAELVRLPGIGPNTAGALLAYAYNKPAVFIETNIRTVVIHHYFAGQVGIDDKLIADVVARTLPDDVRRWYWGLMDYGTYLKRTIGNLNTLSKHYGKQSSFAGSRRQVRGHVLRLLGDSPFTTGDLQKKITDERLHSVLEDLVDEGLIHKDGDYFKLGSA